MMQNLPFSMSNHRRNIFCYILIFRYLWCHKLNIDLSWESYWDYLRNSHIEVTLPIPSMKSNADVYIVMSSIICVKPFYYLGQNICGSFILSSGVLPKYCSISIAFLIYVSNKNTSIGQFFNKQPF